MKTLAAFALLCAGCLQSFEPAHYVTELRVLGVKAEPPEVDPGATSTLTALVVDQSHGDAGVATTTWYLCSIKPVPGSGQDVNPDCFSPDGGALRTQIGEGESIAVTMPEVSPLELGLPDDTFGFYLPVLLRVERDGKSVDAVYKLRYHLPLQLVGLPSQPANTNPRIEQLLAVPVADAGPPVALDESGPSVLHPGWRYTLRATVSAGSAERYFIPEGEPGNFTRRDVTEIISISWFTTAGVLSESVTGVLKPDTELRFDQRTPEPPAFVDLWLVARDERGGADFLRRRFRLQQPADGQQ